jgi:methylisocitrate lyase
MHHRANLYELLDRGSYNHFETNVFNFQIKR